MRWAFSENFSVVLDRHTSEEDSNFDGGHVLAESFVLFGDLESEFSGVAQDNGADLSVDWLHLLESGKNENSGFTHTGFGLAENVHTQNSLWDTFVLYFGWMFKTAVKNSFQQFRFQEKISETGAVNGNIGSLDVLFLAFFGFGLGDDLCLFVIIIEEIVIVVVVVSHCGGFMK
jgi:hypothetical protein